MSDLKLSADCGQAVDGAIGVFASNKYGEFG